jgi:hypothetical protein
VEAWIYESSTTPDGGAPPEPTHENVLANRGGKSMNGTKAVLFARKCSTLPEVTMTSDKWSRFYEMLQESQGKADVVLVCAPEVLGDTYEELVANLSAMASFGLHLAIVPPEDAGFRVVKRLPGTY